jgi:hypothetical protein
VVLHEEAEMERRGNGDDVQPRGGGYSGSGGVWNGRSFGSWCVTDVVLATNRWRGRAAGAESKRAGTGTEGVAAERTARWQTWFAGE